MELPVATMKKQRQPNKETRQGRAAENSARIHRTVQRLMQVALAEAARITSAQGQVRAERLAHIGCLLGKTITPVNELHAGDIGAVAKLRDTLTNDALCDKNAPIEYPAVVLAEPSIAFAIEAKSRQDEDRMGHAVHKILEEDQSLRFYRDPQTKEFLMAGQGQQHVEVIVIRRAGRTQAPSPPPSGP